MQSQEHSLRMLPNSERIERDYLDEFLQRENNLIENLIQIYKQFIRLHTTSEGHIQLNKKLCIIESLKLYIEHLALFNKYDFILPPSINLNDSMASQQNSNGNMKNYFSEIQVSLKIISNRWVKRRQEQYDEYKQNIDIKENVERNFPFTYMIDCIVEECKLYAATSKFLTKTLRQEKQHDPKVLQEECESLFESNSYPPKSIIDLLEICLECNISTQMKQIVVLYVLCDLMHTELSPNVQKHISKLINAYCATSFTLMSTGFDSSQSISWTKSSKSTSIKYVETEDSQESATCLFDFVNGIYLVDSHHLERAFSCLRNTDLTFLEFFEKYFILYNTVHVKEYKIAAQYLWLFQKLNVSSISTSEMNNFYHNNTKNSNDEEKNSIFYNIFSKSSFSNTLSNACISNKNIQIRHEQIMHFKLIITIYLSNHLVNEAYDLIKAQIKNLTSNQNVTDAKLSKELIVHFFFEIEKCKRIFFNPELFLFLEGF